MDRRSPDPADSSPDSSSGGSPGGPPDPAGGSPDGPPDQAGGSPDSADSEDDGGDSDEGRWEAEAVGLRLAAAVAAGEGDDLEEVVTAHGGLRGTTAPYPSPSPGWRGPEKAREAAAAYAAGTIGLHDLVSRLSGVGWGACEWGSAQYSTALAMFRALRALQAAGADPVAAVGWGASEAAVIPAPLPYAEALERVEKGLAQVKRGASPGGRGSLDFAFAAMRGLGWTLWVAADLMCQLVFRGALGREVAAKVPASPGVGSAADLLAQSENYVTGLRCYALAAVGYIRDPDGSFAGFAA